MVVVTAVSGELVPGVEGPTAAATSLVRVWRGAVVTVARRTLTVCRTPHCRMGVGRGARVSVVVMVGRVRTCSATWCAPHWNMDRHQWTAVYRHWNMETSELSLCILKHGQTPVNCLQTLKHGNQWTQFMYTETWTETSEPLFTDTETWKPKNSVYAQWNMDTSELLFTYTEIWTDWWTPVYIHWNTDTGEPLIHTLKHGQTPVNRCLVHRHWSTAAKDSHIKQHWPLIDKLQPHTALTAGTTSCSRHCLLVACLTSQQHASVS